MIKITKSANSTITVYNEDYNNYIMILGSDCFVCLYDSVDKIDINIKTRTVTIFNKYLKTIVAEITGATLDPSSDDYSSNMDTYAASLISTILF